MLIKGSSRANPRQLARHLLRRDQNVHVEILQCDPSPKTDLYEAFEDLQALTQGTKGTKGLYHAQISPDAQYTLRSEQWFRAVDLLEKELGLQGQPRTVVYHEKDGRPHIHVVWQRTNIQTMTLVSDSQNYKAHERASLALEQELGHERTPGCHAKRDPEMQRPTAAFNHAAWQQFERTGIDPRRRKAEITALYHQADNGRAFQQALQQAGYHLAHGDRRALVILDPAAEIHSLNRQIDGVRSRAIKQKLRDLDPEQLPTATQLQTRLRERPHPPPRALSAELPTAEAEARARLDADRRRLIKRLREDRQQTEAGWTKTLAEEKAAYERYLARRRQQERQQDLRDTAPTGALAPMLALWEAFKDRLDPDRVSARQAALEQRERERNERDKLDRANRARELEDWRAQQHLNLRRNLIERRQAFEAQRFEELERLETEARRQRELTQRAQRDRERSGPDRDRDDR
jgi:hypothetical protein